MFNWLGIPFVIYRLQQFDEYAWFTSLNYIFIIYIRLLVLKTINFYLFDNLRLYTQAHNCTCTCWHDQHNCHERMENLHIRLYLYENN